MSRTMPEAVIRKARAGDAAPARNVVIRAYEHYISRIGKRPGPMLADYDGLIAAGAVHVLEDRDGIAGVVVLVPQADHLVLDNVAVDPEFQGRGYGRRLVEFAEDEAKRLGLPEVRLYTNVVMVENVGLYLHLGFEETHRAEHDGYQRVFMRKHL